MPIYTYRCSACGAEFERLVRSDTRVACPSCKGRKLERLMSLTARPAGAGKPADYQPPRPAARWRVLRRRMSLAQPLSPRLARLRAAAGRRTGRSPDGDDASLIWAAVAVVLVPSPDAVLLIRRAERAGDPWSGHMALPGGRREPERRRSRRHGRSRDARGGRTARSTHADLLGSLDDVVPRTPVLPPIAVRPFVFSLARPPAAHAQSRGGRRALGPPRPPAAPRDLPLRPARRPRRAARSSRPTGSKKPIVWGMTERILTGLLEQLRA